MGDLRDPAALDAALAGVEAASFVTPHDLDEEALGRAFLAAAERAGLRRIVFSSAYHPDAKSTFGFAILAGLIGLFTHYGPKLRVELAVRRSRMSPVVLMPSNFYQNDELVLPEILAGRYAQPLGRKGVSRVDCRDIGEAAARALTDPSVASGAYPLVGPEPALTGPDCAARWAEALGREVRYEADVPSWRALVEARMHAREREDFAKTYRIFARRRVESRAAERERAARVVGRPLTRYADYVRDEAAKQA